VFKKRCPFHPRNGYLKVWWQFYSTKSGQQIIVYLNEGSLLVLVYVHNIFPPYCLHLPLVVVMPCTLIHLSIFVNSAYKIEPLAFQIYKLDELS
jgi:hypothetical protein